MNLGKHLGPARKAAAMTQRELARQLDVAPAFLCSVEKGRRPLPDRLLEKLPGPILRQIIDAAIKELEALR